MIFTTGSALASLRPGIKNFWGLGYNRYPEQFSQIFKMETMDMNFDRDVNMYGLGLARVRPEAAGTEYDYMGQGWKYDYVPVDYSNGFKISHQAIRDNLYMKLGEQYTTELANGFRETKEVVCARILNSAFSNTIVYADGLELCSAVHTFAGGGTFANYPDLASDLNELALTNAVIQIEGYTDDRGKKRRVEPRKLIVHRANRPVAERLMMSDLRVGTNNNDINVIKAARYVPELMIYHYLTDEDAWFIQTDCPQGLTFKQREAYSVQSEVEFNTDSILVKAYEAYATGCTDVMAIWGNPGA